MESAPETQQIFFTFRALERSGFSAEPDYRDDHGWLMLEKLAQSGGITVRRLEETVLQVIVPVSYYEKSEAEEPGEVRIGTTDPSITASAVTALDPEDEEPIRVLLLSADVEWVEETGWRSIHERIQVEQVRSAADLQGNGWIDQDWDLVMVDWWLGHESGMKAVSEWRFQEQIHPPVPVIVFADRISDAFLDQAVKSGADQVWERTWSKEDYLQRLMPLVRWRRSVKQAIELERSFLQAQIQPHFLYNALNAIAAISVKQDPQLPDLITRLSRLLRARFEPDILLNEISLAHEIMLTKDYVAIEQVRFGQRLQVIWSIPEEAHSLMVSPFTIQPLVENAIRHGIAKQIQGGIVEVKAISNHDCWEISVSDNGVGISSEAFAKAILRSAAGIGLYNVHRRLYRRNGEGLRMHPEQVEGTKLSFRLSK